MSRTGAAAAGLLALLLAGSLPAGGQQWVGERLCATGLPRVGEFGSAVAVGEDGRIAVGDYRNDVVYLFRRTEEGLCRQREIRGRAGEWFGFDLAITRNQLLVGAPKAGGTGAAYLIELNDDDAEVSRTTLALTPARSGDEIGSSVAIEGRFLAIGARGADDRRGRVYAGCDGNLTAVPMHSDLAQKAELGQSVALAGGTLVIGAPSPFRASGSPGAAYFLELSCDRSPGTPDALPLPADLEPEAAFGYAVAVDGSRILVGAPLADGAGTDAGAVYRFRRNNGTWEQDPAPQPLLTGGRGDQLGVAVVLDDETAVVGARYANGARGAAYLKEGNGAPQPLEQSIQPRDQPVPASAQFGFSVAIRGGIAVVGAFRERGAGAAYLFEHQFVPAVELAVAGQVEEKDTALSVTLRTSDGNPVSRDFTFRITTEDGTAKSAEGDYSKLTEENITLPAGKKEVKKDFPMSFQDDRCENKEDFQVVLSDLSGRSIDAEKVVIVDDDGSAGELKLSATRLQTSESGTKVQLSVSLTCPPTADFDISLSTSDPTEGTVSPVSLRFTSADWEHTVEVVGKDDALCDDDQTYSVEAQPTSTAPPPYAGLTRSIDFVNTDDELACLSVTEKTVCTDGGGTVVYTIALSNEASDGPGALAELRDILPAGITVVTASADRGIATADPVANSVRWTGTVPAAGDGAATITIVAALDGPPDPVLENRADLSYVRDGRGHRETLPVVFEGVEVVSCPP